MRDSHGHILHGHIFRNCNLHTYYLMVISLSIIKESYLYPIQWVSPLTHSDCGSGAPTNSLRPWVPCRESTGGLASIGAPRLW